MAVTGNGVTITFSTTSLTGAFTSIGHPALSIEPLEDSTLSNSSFASYVPSDLKQIAPFDGVMWFAPEDDWGAELGSVQTITLTYGSSETLSGTGFITNYAPAENVNNTLTAATISIQLDGKTGPTITTAT